MDYYICPIRRLMDGIITHYVILILFLLSCVVYAQPPNFVPEEAPKLVFRFDTRPPNIIFVEGFKLRNPNGSIDLLDHFANPNSAFIATSSSVGFAEAFAVENLFSLTTKRNQVTYIGYIYTIVPNENFYSVGNSFHAVGDTMQVLERLYPKLALNTYRAEGSMYYLLLQFKTCI